jgi:Xaa-Pro aminopeptidase
VVEPAPEMGDNRAQLSFETLTFVPFDRRLILVGELSPGDRTWLDAYHATVLEKLGNRVSQATLAWLTAACAPMRGQSWPTISRSPPPRPP